MADNDQIVLLTSKTPKDKEAEEETYVNVGERFRFWFQILFSIHLFMMVCVILLRLVKPTMARLIYFFLPQFLIPILLFGNLMLFYSRFVHSGRVCSGDYLDTKTEPSTGYLVAQGSLIKTYASILSVAIYLVWCCICFVSARKTQANTKKREEQARAATRLANM